MKNLVKYLLFTVAGLLVAFNASAEKYKGDGGNKNVTTVKSTAAGCFQSGGFKYLDINNVRTRVNAGGDMWWDFENGDYEIPNGSGKTSMFSASLWIGGYDPAGNLKLAAIRYRQGPNVSGAGSATDYWPGPLRVDGTASVDPEVCSEYDRLFEITREEVDNYLAWVADPTSFPEYSIPKSITEWPAHGMPGEDWSYYLAPFNDVNGNEIYDPGLGGDYPYYDVENTLGKNKVPTMDEAIGGYIKGSLLADQVIKGDATLWWVFNDKGNVHTESEGEPIGLEIRAQAFGFSTNDVINDMTFYSYEIINRSTIALTETYFSQWVDTDLGYSGDDYVGCDVERGLGYCYNGLTTDGTGQPFAYGENPPAIGVDFFQGPYMDPDGYDNPSYKKIGRQGPNIDNCDIVDLAGEIVNIENAAGLESTKIVPEGINGVNFGDGIVDNERFGMKRFVYHNNSSGGDYMTDPKYAPEYYQFLTGIWKDGSKMIYGGNGHSSAGGYGPETDFMFPGLSDPCWWGTKGEVPQPPTGTSIDWTETTAGNGAADRRFMQSAGPFTLESGAVNYITVGIPWARASVGGPEASVALLKQADDVCQNLFDNNFQVINGPNAPDMTIREMDQKLIIYLTNKKSADAGNNYKEGYEEYDFNIVPPTDLAVEDRWDTTYNFEGYMVYQLSAPTVSVADLDDPSKARLIFQCDVENDISRIINFESDRDLGAVVPVEKVNGANEGIKNTFEVTTDAFTNEDIINNKQYYFLAIAYAHNEFYAYSQDPDVQTEGVADLDGQKLPYLAGRKNIKSYTGIPHQTVGVTRLNSAYGDEIAVTRIEGRGNGGRWLDITESTETVILSKEPASEENVMGDELYPIAYEVEYEAGASPIQVSVIDPFYIKDAQYEVRFDTLYKITQEEVSVTPNILGDTLGMFIGRWTLRDLSTGVDYISDTTIETTKEQIFMDLGFSVTISQTYKPGWFFIGKVPTPTDQNANKKKSIYFSPLENQGFLGATYEFENPQRPWLSGVPDADMTDIFDMDWIRSGATNLGSSAQQDVSYTGGTMLDLEEQYENLLFPESATSEVQLGGTWAPYVMTASIYQNEEFAPFYEYASGSRLNATTLKDLNSIDIVLTSDKDKWTRATVIEMGSDVDSTEGGAERMMLRLGKSVNINGETDVESDDPQLNSNYIDTVGMGWFPGYAIDVETGERLNIAFGEDSRFIDDNGRDMMWNPTDRMLDSEGQTVFGGRHVIWVFRSTYINYVHPQIPDTSYSYQSGPYDGGANMNVALKQGTFRAPASMGGMEIPTTSGISPVAFAWKTATWCGVPLKHSGYDLLDNDVRLKFRVGKPYDHFYNDGLVDSAYAADNNVNDHYPMYKFSTSNVIATEDMEKAKSDLDYITVVPNPYYGFSTYETSQLDNRVKITNLPEECTVTIYGLNGSLIRQFTKADPVTFIDWDLKNFAGIPISGGLYYIHVDAGDIGEEIVKFYAIMRPVDLNSF